MVVHRIAQARYARNGKQMMSGIGGLHSSQRWHSKGHRIVYTSTSLPLAVLEVLANLQQTDKLQLYRVMRVEVPDELVAAPAAGDLPEDWNERDGEPLAARAYGDGWLASHDSVALLVPSAVLPSEFNVLLNPEHEDYHHITYDVPLPVDFDPRLIAAKR